MSDIPTITPETFRRAIKDAREAAGFSKNDLARRLACSGVFIGAVENGTSFPSPTRCGQFARVLSLDESSLRAAVAAAQTADANARLVARARRRAERYAIAR